jgi:hypothetical protein
VTLGETNATIVDQSDTSISLVVQASDAASDVDVTIISDTGAIVVGAALWTYLDEGSVDAVTPDSGRVGTTVVITGSNLRGGGANVDSVTLDGETAEITGESDDQVNVTAPAGSASGAGSVVITSASGAVVSADAAWTFVDSSIDSVSPASGQIGVVITIAGSVMLGGGSSATSITLAGVEAVDGASSVDDDEIVLAAPSSAAATGDVVITADTGAVVTLEDGFEFLDASAVTSIDPAKGQFGTLVTIEGTDLLGGGADDSDENITSAKLGNVAAEVVFSNGTYIVLKVKNGDAGKVDVTLVATSGALTAVEEGFEYLALGEVQTVEPNFGQVGTVVTLSGERMLGGGSAAASVTLVGASASIVDATDDSIEVQAAPASSVAQGDVVVTSDSGSVVTLAGGFTYKTASEVETVQPAEGQVGTVVTIKGSSLRGGADSVDVVTLAGVEADIDTESNTVVKVVAAQSEAVADGDVVVTANSGAVATLAASFSYATEGEVSDVSPSSGQTGTVVVISGSALRGSGSNVSQVFLGDAEATIDEESDDEVTVVAAAGPDEATTVDIKLVSDSGAVVTGSDAFDYLLPGEIKFVNPSSGQDLTEVTITGERLCGGGDEVVEVTLAGLAADIVNPNCNLIQITANDLGSQVTGAVTIVSNTGAIVTKEDAFEYLGAGNISSVTPNAGQGTTVVTIEGNSLIGGGEEVVSVTIAGVNAQPLSDNTNTTYIVVRANVGPTAEGKETGDVVVTGDTGVSITAVNAFTYSTVTAIEPESGQGGTEVTITGIKLLAAGSEIAKVTLDGIEVESIVSESETQVVVIASAINHEQDQKGTAVITMDNGQVIESVALQDGSLVHEFTYVVPGEITSVSPTQGQQNSVVTIVGTDLFGQGEYLTNVSLAGVEAEIVSQSNTKVVVTAGASGATDAGDVILTSESGAIVEIAAEWTYVAVGEITDVSPGKGQLNTEVTITGTDLMAGGVEIDSVTLAGVAIKELVSNSSTKVVVIAALSSNAITGDIVLTSENGAVVVLSDGFEYVAVPSFTELNPTSGQGGTEVTITGTGLFAGDDDLVNVTLNGIEATITSEADDEVVVTVGTGSGAGTGDVVFTMSSGATATGEDLFEYLAEGDVTAVTPAKGQGNTIVTIEGTNLLGGGSSVSVTLADADVASVEDASDEKIIVVVDAGSAAEGDVVITADTGAVITETDGWTQLDEGVVNDVTPVRGRHGTTVVITGERLLGGGSDIDSVTLDGVTAEYEAGSATDDEVTVVAAGSDKSNSAGDVVLTADTGATITASEAFSYEGSGNVTGFSPDSGQFGTEVVISGEDLLGGGSEIVSVKLAGVEVAEIKESNNTIVVVIADGSSNAVKGSIELTANTGAQLTTETAFTYGVKQNITTIEPAKAQYGTRVTVSGDNLLGGGASVASITMAGVEHVDNILSESSTAIAVEIADGDAASGNVVITADTGAQVSSDAGSFVYVANGEIENVSPTSGQERSPVTITGQRLLGGGDSAATVTLAGLEAEVDSSSAAKVVVFAARSASATTGDIVITADTGAIVTGTDAWEYIEPGVIESVTPNNGQEGTNVVINGSLLLGSGDSATKVTLAGVEATIVDSTQTGVVVTAAESDDDVVGDVKIVSDSGVQVTAEDGFTYSKNGFIASLEPAQGVEGTEVFIYGQDLQGQGDEVVSVTLSGVAATIVKETNFYISVTAQAGDAGDAGDVVLTADSGAVITKEEAWTYVTAGQIDELEPNEGSPGTAITIKGSDMRSGADSVTKVTLANVAANIVSQNDDEIVVEAGEVSTIDGFTGDVVLTNNNGAVVTLEDGFSYLADSDVHTVTPNIGQFGTIVTITGINLLSGVEELASLTLAGTEAEQIVSQNSSMVVLVAAAPRTLSPAILCLMLGTVRLLNEQTGGHTPSQPMSQIYRQQRVKSALE